MQTAEKKQVISAIGDLGRRVTAADVATKTGLPILVVQQSLNQVASETGGHLQVSTTGDIAYSFAPGFSNAYLARGIQAFFQSAGEKLWRVAFYLLRISFGIMLILSLIIVVVLIFIVVTAMLRGGRGGRSSDDDSFSLSGFNFSFWDWMVLRDILWWNAYSTGSPARYDYNQPTVRARRNSNFLLNCFSFLFGDGDPNEGLSEKRWQLIAQVIKRNNNVMTAEQLAPYTGKSPGNEDGVLPVLVRFNGRPEVTEKGNIIYVFDSMHSTAADQYHNPPSFLKEFPWKFTNVPSADLIPVYLVAGLNFGGAWWLWFFLHSQHVASSAAMQGVSSLFALVNVLVVYGTLFLAIPAARWFWQNMGNQKIETRNNQRFRFAQMVANPSGELAAKLKESVAFRVRDTHIEPAELAYTTEKAALDQEDDLDSQFKGGSLESKQREKLERDFDASP